MFDFYSDCRTLPSRGMLETVLTARLGDEQRKEDPTTSGLLARVAGLLGKEDAIFMTSGTMCNEVALYVMCPRGDVLIAERGSHVLTFEAGGPAALANAQIYPLDGERGMFTPKQVRTANAITGKSGHHYATGAVLWVEQTTNLGGGAVWPLDQLQAVTELGHSLGLRTYMDGARLFNASAKSGLPVKAYADCVDAVGIDFTKGLGCPFGAVLAGSHEFIERCWKVRQMFGGGMRQSGVMAAMANYSLDHNVARLSDDHSVASFIASALQGLEMIEEVSPVETNIIIFKISTHGPTAAQLVSFLEERGFRVGAFGERTIRIVTHLNVDMAAAEELMFDLRTGLQTLKAAA